MFSILEMDCTGHAGGVPHTVNGRKHEKHQESYQLITNNHFLMHIHHLIVSAFFHFYFLSVVDSRMLKNSSSCAQIQIRQKHTKK